MKDSKNILLEILNWMFVVLFAVFVLVTLSYGAYFAGFLFSCIIILLLPYFSKWFEEISRINLSKYFKAMIISGIFILALVVLPGVDKSPVLLFNSSFPVGDCTNDVSQTIPCVVGMDVINSEVLQLKDVYSFKLEFNGEIPRKERLKTNKSDSFLEEAYFYTFNFYEEDSKESTEYWMISLTPSKGWEKICFNNKVSFKSCKDKLEFKQDGRTLFVSGKLGFSLDVIKIESQYEGITPFSTINDDIHKKIILVKQE